MKADSRARNSFGKTMSDLLHDRRMNRTELSKRMDVSLSYVSSLARGGKTASANTADRIADAVFASDPERVRLHRAAAADNGFCLQLPEDFDD